MFLLLLSAVSFALADTGSEDTGVAEPPICDEGTALIEGDFDGDGLPDETEDDCGSDPCDPDTDGDGVWDGDEVQGHPPCGPDSDQDGTPDLLDPTQLEPCGSTEDTVRGEAGQHGLSGGRYTGGACQTASPSGALLPILLVVGALFGRRRAPIVMVAGLWVLPVRAQEINVQRLSPAVGDPHFVWMQSSQVAPQVGGIQALSHWSRKLLVYRRDNRPDELLVDHLWTTDLGSFFSHGPAMLSVNVPIHGLVTGYPTSGPRWLGDVTMGAKWRLLNPDTTPLGLSLSGRLSLPTGNSQMWLGAPGAHGEGHINLSMGKTLVVATNLGMMAAPRTDLDDVAWGGGFSWRVGVSGPATNFLRWSTELDVAHHQEGKDVPGAHPAEALAALRATPVPDLCITVGGGTGLSQGIGAPLYRLVVGAAWAPSRREETPGPPPAPPPDPPVSEVPPEEPPPAPEMFGPTPEEALQVHVPFHLGSTGLRPDAVDTLEEVVLILQRHPEIRLVEVQGHAARSGSENTALSQSRAETVMIWLVSHGVSGKRLSARGYGATQSAEIQDPDARERVQFHIVAQDPPSTKQ